MKNINWGLILTIAACILFWVLVLGCAGCGVHAELTYNPETDTWDAYYYNGRLLGPENVTLTIPNGASLTIGEQATQNAVIGKLTDTVTILSGGVK